MKMTSCKTYVFATELEKKMTMTGKSQASLIALLAASLAVLAPQIVSAQSTEPEENKLYMEKTTADMIDYVDGKCGDFRVDINFDDSAFDYNTNPTEGSPTNASRVFAGIYAIAAVCESGDAPSNRLKSKFSSITITPGTAPSARLAGGTLVLTYNPRDARTMSEMRDVYTAQLRRF
jgi:hypothetical protein